MPFDSDVLGHQTHRHALVPGHEQQAHAQPICSGHAANSCTIFCEGCACKGIHACCRRVYNNAQRTVNMHINMQQHIQLATHTPATWYTIVARCWALPRSSRSWLLSHGECRAAWSTSHSWNAIFCRTWQPLLGHSTVIQTGIQRFSPGGKLRCMR